MFNTSMLSHFELSAKIRNLIIKILDLRINTYAKMIDSVQFENLKLKIFISMDTVQILKSKI